MHGGDHVVYQNDGISYYVSPLFRHSKTVAITVPCFIRDVLDHYRHTNAAIKKYYSQDIGLWFFNNHPIDRVMILGCIVGWKWKMIGDVDYAMFMVDDCTLTDDHTSLLKCKCSKSLILQSGLPLGNLSGWRLKVCGRMNSYEELEADYLDICSDLVDEIEFWKEGIKVRETLKQPWILDDSSLGLYFAEDKEPLIRKGTFIEYLEQEQFRKDLEIANTYCLEDEELARNEIILPIPEERSDLEFDLDQSHLMEFNEMHGAVSQIMYTTEPLEQGQTTAELSLPVTNSNQASETYSLNFYKQRFIRYLLQQKNSEISTLNTFRNPYLNNVLSSISIAKMNQQSSIERQPLENIKSYLFSDVLKYFANMGLIVLFADAKLINTKNLKSCYHYIEKRTSTIIKLQCYTGKIDYQQVRDLVGYQNLTKKVIVELFKEALKKHFGTSGQSTTRWWIDMSNETASFIHFEFG